MLLNIKLFSLVEKVILHTLAWFRALKSNHFEDVFTIENNRMSGEKRRLAFCIGFGDWKPQYIKLYLPKYHLAFIDYRMPIFRVLAILKCVEQDYDVFIWSYKENQSLLNYFIKKNKYIIRVEDGFIRSIGLGVNETKPLSLIFDNKDLYFDKDNETGLEKIIFEKAGDYKEKELEYARKIMNKMIENKITKYNFITSKDMSNFLYTSKKKIILVIGQVEDDMSIKKGCSSKCSNIDLLKTAKKENENAIIIFKPHPDILSGKRSSTSNIQQFSQYSNKVVTQGSILEYIAVADHIYTITSLSGFEALIRGKKVTCLGSPFYAHWGLTDDRAPKPKKRKDKTMNLENLFIAAYMKYPTYLHGNIEETIKRIIDEK